ncbi:hypothetical protein PVIIG_06174 [Plasmodium vivax India VII]|uniref:Variable surface protein Vir12 n=1 Tax=Plasmodium vivax India VII TaxID=1077284 RepID=A0A0J9S2C1_PLAVI|nr:hypothetical protein PVIIG_06174 [Plasmodium vivax India VII]
MATSPEKNWVEVLQNLPSYKEYEKFDKVDIKNENSSHCNNLGSTDEGDKTFCKKVVKILSQLSALKDDENLKNSCYYFQHWFFDNIAKKYYNGNIKGNNYPVAQKLFNIVSDTTPVFSRMEPCNCYESGSPDVWKKEKYLHDFFENHKDIKCNDSNKSKCEKYVNYVTYIKTLYENKEDDCCEDEELYIGGFCQSYFNCKNKYSPNSLLTELKKELQLLDKKPEAPRDGGTGGVAVDAKANPGTAVSEGAESGVPKPAAAKPAPVKPAPAKPVAAKPPVTKPAPSEAAPAKPVAAKPATAERSKEESEGKDPARAKPVAAKPAPEEPLPVKPAPAKPVAAKPVAAKVAPEEPVQKVPEPKVSVSPEPEPKVSPPEVPEQEVVETVDTLEHEETMSPRQMESAEQSVHEVSSYTTELANNVVPLTIADSPNTLGTTHEELDSNFFRNVIMAIAVLGTIFFLFYYNRVIAHSIL